MRFQVQAAKCMCECVPVWLKGQHWFLTVCPLWIMAEWKGQPGFVCSRICLRGRSLMGRGRRQEWPQRVPSVPVRAVMHMFYHCAPCVRPARRILLTSRLLLALCVLWPTLFNPSKGCSS